MAELRVRPMSAGEFTAFRSRAVAEYAEDHVRAGDWSEQEAERIAAEQTESLLPQGRDTPGMLFLTAEDEHGLVGSAWVGIEQKGVRGAWIYVIEVQPEQRGRGRGRALLALLEQAAREAGACTIGLNVFADNHVARGLYESTGYVATSVQMRKELQ